MIAVVAVGRGLYIQPVKKIACMLIQTITKTPWLERLLLVSVCGLSMMAVQIARGTGAGKRLHRLNFQTDRPLAFLCAQVLEGGV